MSFKIETNLPQLTKGFDDEDENIKGQTLYLLD